MKLFCSSLCSVALAAAALASVNPQLHQVKRIYILSMGSGMDQYLANQLTTAGLFEVVTDPKRADAIVTDNVGESFEKKLDELYPPPPKLEVAKAQADATRITADAASSIDVGDSNAAEAKPGRKNAFDGIDFSGGGRPSSIGRGKGNFFVVDRTSRTVLWSVYERPKNSTPAELTKTAGRVVKHLKDDLTDKKQAE